MIEDRLANEYFEWMYHLVCDDQYSKRTSFRKLLCHLHDTKFFYILPMDGNRAEDGVELRYKFAQSCGYDYHLIATYLDVTPCSVLEMMIALAMRCEDHIMGDPDLGDRLGQWFWSMIVNLKLGSMCDERYDKYRVDEALHIFLNRQYDRNGDGGLFKVECPYDLRDIEIWYQMCWYLQNIIDE